jgi:hypothetical protein
MRTWTTRRWENERRHPCRSARKKKATIISGRAFPIGGELRSFGTSVCPSRVHIVAKSSKNCCEFFEALCTSRPRQGLLQESVASLLRKRPVMPPVLGVLQTALRDKGCYLACLRCVGGKVLQKSYVASNITCTTQTHVCISSYVSSKSHT